ncbi:cyclic nucleotide-binding domain-containing protein 1 isoform X1 [Acipenser oxyrinchus oxyrinchus]|uniref:Cyclic nucleotide-binding domain-containing protein 1 isoform X1 n=1 Tax=Acipenser oxyrinchus oxyrinchus TaxID=40147 RepID=A0AAD8LRW6_ACIOX|nr:cyclic nucleotide-binding domain-containing protein 1 isoform X1 [Acipenser oxyrinchus oxyrinchus]
MSLAAVQSSRSLQKTQIQPFIGIDYCQLETACQINGLQNKHNLHTTDEAHDLFMNAYPNIFLKPKMKLPRIPFKEKKIVISKGMSDVTEEDSHDIRIHLEKLQRRRKVVDLAFVYRNQISCLLKILKKIPAERTQTEQQDVYKVLKVFPDIAAQISNREMKQVSKIVILESWEKRHTIFGNNGFYVILKGSVRPVTLPYKKLLGEPYLAGTHSPLVSSCNKVLTVGCCFGTLEKIPNCELNSKRLAVIAEEDCELLKISNRDYARIKAEIAARDPVQNQELILHCPFYQQWPRLSINKLATLIEMRKLPAGYVLVKEGEVSPFAGYIKSGQSNILRDIGAFVKRPLGKLGIRVKHVIICKLTENESFGEVSILLNQPSTCTIVTETEVELGVILPSALQSLDSVTQALILQTAQPIFAELTQEEINKKYLSQEKQKEWEHFKHKVIWEALHYNGIRPGSGKWVRPWGRRKLQRGGNVSQSSTL